MDEERKVIITGCNKGIGFAILKKLVQKHKDFEFIMAVRSTSKGEDAKSELEKILPGVSHRIHIEKLDLADSESISKFIANIKKKYGQVDALINNAGFAYHGDAFGPEVVENTFKPNFYGTVELTEKMIDLIQDNGKIITVGSSVGKLKLIQSESLLKKFDDSKLTKSKLFSLAQSFYDAVVKGDYSEKGFPKKAYGMSKLCLNLYVTKILTHQKNIIEKNIQVYALCPGWCRTDMAGQRARKSADEGADTPVYLMNLPWKVDKELQGKFFYERKATPL